MLTCSLIAQETSGFLCQDLHIITFRHLKPDKNWQNRTEKQLWFVSLNCRDILPGIELTPYTEKIPPDDTFTAEEKTCNLLGKTNLSIISNF